MAVVNIDKKMTDIMNPKEQMIIALEPFDQMSEQIAVAPLAINVLGQLCLISADQDFSLRCDENSQFNLIATPDSFRATLAQITHAGYKAFQKADSTMECIRLHTSRVPLLLKTVLQLLYDPISTREDLEAYLPINLEEIRQVADECIEEASSVEKEFGNVIDLLAEVQQKTLNKQGKTKEARDVAETRLKYENEKNANLEKQRKEAESEFQKVSKEFAEHKDQFNNALASMPGAGEIMVGALVEGISNVFNGVSQLLFAGNMSRNEVITSNGIENDEETKGHKESLKKVTGQKAGLKAEDVRFYCTNLATLNQALIQITDLFQLNKNNEITVADRDEAGKKNFPSYIGLLESFAAEFKRNKGTKKINQKVLGNIESIKQNLKTLEKGERGKEKLNKMKADIEQSAEEIAEIEMSVKYMCNIPQFAKKGPEMSKAQSSSSSSSSSVVGNMIENAHKKVEMTRMAMESARKAESEANQRRIEVVNEINNTIANLQKLQMEKKQHENILVVISEGLKAFAKLQDQWAQLVQFFANISNVIKCSLSKDMNMFVKNARVTNVQSIKGREIVYQSAFQSVKMSSVINHLSSTYCDISKKHLIPLNNKLYEILALDPEQDKCAMQQVQRNLNTDCQNVNLEIKKYITRKHENYKITIDQRIKTMQNDLQTDFPLPNAKKQEIRASAEQVVEDVAYEPPLSIDNEELDDAC